MVFTHLARDYQNLVDSLAQLAKQKGAPVAEANEWRKESMALIQPDKFDFPDIPGVLEILKKRNWVIKTHSFQANIDGWLHGNLEYMRDNPLSSPY